MREMRFFTDEPKPPYDIDDIWHKEGYGYLYCIRERKKGEQFKDEDWGSKYEKPDVFYSKGEPIFYWQAVLAAIPALIERKETINENEIAMYACDIADAVVREFEKRKGE